MTDWSVGRILVAAAILVVVVAVVGGMVLLGPPSEQRQQRLDEKRVSDLERIAQAVSQYRFKHDRLPTILEELKNDPTLSVTTTDPETGQPYSYRGKDEETFELCAVFARATGEEPTAPNVVGRWQHRAGTQCFDLRARPR